MGAQAPLPPEPLQQPLSAPVQPTWWQRHGTTASWIALFFSALTVLGLFVNIYLTVSANSAKKTDEHTNGLIDAKLGLTIKDLNQSIDKKLEPGSNKLEHLSEDINRLSDRVARLEGPNGRISKLETRTNQQISLARIMDPDRSLRMIKAELQVARASGKLLPVSDVEDYRNAVQAFSVSSREYWATVAAIINYQSWLNQVRGGAPDPAVVSGPCGGEVTNTPGIFSEYNVFQNSRFEKCIIDLDRQGFKNVTFTDSVIRYHGGQVLLNNVTFVNCTFLLDLPAPQSPVHPEVLRTLLASDLKQVTLSTHS
jgi:hypothetical protein